MILDRIFRRRPTQSAGQALYLSVVKRARRPELYQDLGVPDTVEGRFELYSLFTVLLLDRLRGHGAPAAETSQALFDAYVAGLDDALRDMGVGDLSMGKKMRRLGEAFYGRVKSYQGAFAAIPDTSLLQALIGRTVYAEGDTALAPRLAELVLTERAALSDLALEELLQGRVTWAV